MVRCLMSDDDKTFHSDQHLKAVKWWTEGEIDPNVETHPNNKLPSELWRPITELYLSEHEAAVMRSLSSRYYEGAKYPIMCIPQPKKESQMLNISFGVPYEYTQEFFTINLLTNILHTCLPRLPEPNDRMFSYKHHHENKEKFYDGLGKLLMGEVTNEGSDDS